MRIITIALFVFVFLLASAGTLFAQDNYYWSGGEKIALDQDRSTAVLIYEDAAATQGQALTTQGLPGAQAFGSDGGKQVVLQFDRPQSGTLATVLRDAQVDRSNLKWFSYGFRNQADVEYLPTNRIVFELKEGRPLSEVRALVPDGVRFESAKYFRYVVAQSPGVDLLALANRIYESGLVEYAHPDFMVEKRRTADPLYSEQYYLNNTSSNLGTADVDIDAPEAWNLTKGSSQIRVAVIDDGVEAHEDLEDASGNSRVLNGYTPQTGGNGRPTWDQRPDGRGGTETAGHGVASAGIVAASHNSVGVRGVAPNVKVVPINIFNGGVGNRETPSDIAAGINWAWDEGNADVLSNSWGYPGGRPTNFDVIVDAIQDARTQGRNGRGSIVIFSAGNFFNGSQATETFFPASVSGVMAVGAVDRNDNRWDYTPSAGNDIDVVAPSGDTQLMGDVRTTDRMGTLGYERSSGDNYTPRFGGTSAAAPQVAGTAALVLSRNLNLTEQEVRTIIEDNADDYGSTNWDGNGRLNAYGAVSNAGITVTLSGPSIVESGQEGTWTADVEGGEGSASYSWSVRELGATSWTGICSGQTCSYTFTNFSTYVQDVEIRVTVDKGSETDADSQWVTVSPGAPGCEPWMIECPSTQLANLRSFEAEPQGESAQLAWTTTGSMGEGTFLVQHRADSTAAWSDLQTVEVAERVRADSTDAPTYQLETDALAPGTHQFRLQWAAGGETALLSDVVEAEITLEDPYQLRAYPNPAGAQMTVESAVKERQHVRVHIYDVLGRRVTTVYDGPMAPNEVKHFTVQPGVDGLSSGTYFLRMTGEQFQTTTRISVVR